MSNKPKTFTLTKRKGFNGDFFFVDRKKTLDLCVPNMLRLFNIPDNVKKIWVTLSTEAQKGFYEAKYVSGWTFRQPAVILDDKKIAITRGADSTLWQNDVRDNQPFYFKIEYTGE